MKPAIILIGAVLAAGGQAVVAGTSERAGFETNFVAGATLSARDLDSVVKLAKLSGMDRVFGVSTERHLSGITITVRGDEKIDGRKVVFKTLGIHRDGWQSVKRPTQGLRSVAEFWVEASTQPQTQERTIVRIGDRELWVGLLNGIKPEGADKVIGALLSGRVRYASDYVKGQASGIDFLQPRWLGISSGQCWISFSSPGPLTRIVFRVVGDEVTITDVVQMYE